MTTPNKSSQNFFSIMEVWEQLLILKGDSDMWKKYISLKIKELFFEKVFLVNQILIFWPTMAASCAQKLRFLSKMWFLHQIGSHFGPKNENFKNPLFSALDTNYLKVLTRFGVKLVIQ